MPRPLGNHKWKGPGAGRDARAHTRHGVCARSSRLVGLAAQRFLDQPLAERPQGPRRLLALGFRGGQAAAAVVEIHPSQALEFGSSSAVDGGGGSLLLEMKGKRPKNTFVFKNGGGEVTFFALGSSKPLPTRLGCSWVAA